jgi:hypothetical protein
MSALEAIIDMTGLQIAAQEMMNAIMPDSVRRNAKASYQRRLITSNEIAASF